MLPKDRTDAVLYVALGDSTVEGVGATTPERNYVSRVYDRLRSIYPNARVVNLGVSGATSVDVVTDQLSKAVELHPTLITLSIGPNDITARVRLEEYERNLDTILQRLTRETRAVLVVNLLPDLGVTPRYKFGAEREIVERLTSRFNDALARKARRHGAEVVDLYAASREEVPRRLELIAADGYHPSDEGYARWATLMWNGIAVRIQTN